MTLDNAYAWHCLGKKLGPAVLALAFCASAHGGLYTFNYGVNATIPDNSIIGLTDAHAVSGLDSPITDIRVSLNISGGFNGDLYGYLRLNGSPLVVLVNRVGMTSSNPDGYANSGMLVTLSASAAYDIHSYQSFSPSYNSSGQVTGTWQADGRTSPLDTSRGSLSAFNGLDPNGTWTLFFADRSAGDQSTLAGWSLEITTVPEPVNVALGIFAGVFLVVLVVRSRPVRNRVQRWRAAAVEWINAV
jgi:subtilisin-like proprotein convertase family protein